MGIFGIVLDFFVGFLGEAPIFTLEFIYKHFPMKINFLRGLTGELDCISLHKPMEGGPKRWDLSLETEQLSLFIFFSPQFILHPVQCCSLCPSLLCLQANHPQPFVPACILCYNENCLRRKKNILALGSLQNRLKRSKGNLNLLYIDYIAKKFNQWCLLSYGSQDLLLVFRKICAVYGLPTKLLQHTKRISADEGTDASVVDLNSPFQKRKKLESNVFHFFYIIIGYMGICFQIQELLVPVVAIKFLFLKLEPILMLCSPKCFSAPAGPHSHATSPRASFPFQSMLLASQGPLQQFSHTH